MSRTGPSHPRASRALVLDDHSAPGARAALGSLLGRSSSADIAVDRVRLAAIDFRERDLERIETCRVVLGRLDVHALIDAADAASRTPVAAANVAVLRHFIGTGRLQVRSAGTRRWRPDFCVLRGDGLRRVAPGGSLCLLGHLGIGSVDRGPTLSCIVSGESAADRAAGAFDRLWADAHDVLDVVAETLGRFALKA